MYGLELNTIEEIMRVNIVNYEKDSWILEKFALKMQSELAKMEIECSIKDCVDKDADINHHLIYNNYNGVPSSHDTLMITHIDDSYKLEKAINGVKNSCMGICMSSQMMNWLVQMGADKTKLCYVVPAHDQVAKPRKTKIGLASRVYPDGRKNEKFLNRLAKELDPAYFRFTIMGAGWENQVDALRAAGFEVEYDDEFIREKYYPMIESLDYYLYMGHDEGQMGFVDAAAAGVPSIVTPQGYHLDAPAALTNPFDTYEELRDILLSIQDRRKAIVNSVADWTWKDYTIKHVEIWKHILGEEVSSLYVDGLNSNLKLKDMEIASHVDTEEEKRKLDLLTKERRSNTRKSMIKDGSIIKAAFNKLLRIAHIK